MNPHLTYLGLDIAKLTLDLNPQPALPKRRSPGQRSGSSEESHWLKKRRKFAVLCRDAAISLHGTERMRQKLVVAGLGGLVKTTTPTGRRFSISQHQTCLPCLNALDFAHEHAAAY